jgi:hypothetical protein
MTISVNHTAHGTQISDGDRIQFFAPNGIVDHPAMKASLAPLVAALAGTAETMAERSAELTATGRIALARTMLSPTAPAHFQAAQRAVPAALAAVDREDADMRPKRPALSDARAAEHRGHALRMKLPDVIRIAADDHEFRRAVAEGSPAMSGLPADIHARLQSDDARDALAAAWASQHAKASPSADDPVPASVDMAPAYAWADAFNARVAAERQAIASVSPFLASVVTVVAAMTDATRDDAFAFLTGATP